MNIGGGFTVLGVMTCGCSTLSVTIWMFSLEGDNGEK